MNYKKTLFFVLLSLLCSFAILNSSFAGNVDLSQINQFVPNTPAKASEVNSNFETLRNAINDNDVKTNQAATDINSLNSNVDGLNSNMSNLTSHVNSLDSDINGLNSEVNGIKSNIDGLSSNMDGLGADVNGLSSDIDGLNSNINALSSDINGLSSDINDLNIDINNHKSYPDAHHPRYTDAEAVNAMKEAGIGELTNNSVTTDFTGTFMAQNVSIPDGDPVGVTSTITIPDIGIIDSINISVEINTSDISELDIKLIDPNSNVYLLYERNDWAQGTTLTGSWPDPNSILDGDITIWTDKNPKGNWKLWVIDHSDDGLEDDGEITEWSITIKGFSTDTVTVNADLTVNGSIRANGGGALITPTKMLISRVQNTIFFTAADGSQHTLNIADITLPVGNTHIHYYPNCTENDCKSGDSNNESVLFLNMEGSPSICCTLLGDEDDHTSVSKGLYWATDNGNNSMDAWGNSSTPTFKLSKDGISDGIPMGNYSSYAIICF
ncbi:MAG: proprotein convertase P-domain-containing protein [bacterium]